MEPPAIRSFILGNIDISIQTGPAQAGGFHHVDGLGGSLGLDAAVNGTSRTFSGMDVNTSVPTADDLKNSVQRAALEDIHARLDKHRLRSWAKLLELRLD